MPFVGRMKSKLRHQNFNSLLQMLVTIFQITGYVPKLLLIKCNLLIHINILNINCIYDISAAATVSAKNYIHIYFC